MGRVHTFCCLWPLFAASAAAAATTHLGNVAAGVGSMKNITLSYVVFQGNSVLSYTNVDTLVSATEKEGAEVCNFDLYDPSWTCFAVEV